MTRSTLSKALLTAALVPLVLTAACGGTTRDSGGGSGGGDTSQPIVLGTSLSKTGPLGQFGVDLEIGYQQKISEINAAGGLDVGGTKRQLTLAVLDNRSDPNTATQQIRELVLKNNAVALLGACTPPIVIPEALAAEQQKIPFVSTCNPVQAFQGGNDGGWNYAWDFFISEQDQAANVAKGVALAKSNKKVALFTDNEPDGVAERPLYKKAAEANGLEVVGDYTFPVGTTDFSSFITDAKSKGAQLVVGQMIPPDAIALWKQMKAQGFKPEVAFVAKASTGSSWPKALGPIAEGTLSEGLWTPDTGKANSQELMDTLGKQYPNNLPDLSFAVMGYTVAAVVTDAITAAGSTEADKVSDAIGKTDADYPLGRIAFDDKHTAVTPYLLTQWQNQNTVLILPSTPASSLQTPVKGLQ